MRAYGDNLWNVNNLHNGLAGPFRRGIQSHAPAPTQTQNCLDV